MTERKFFKRGDWIWVIRGKDSHSQGFLAEVLSVTSSQEISVIIEGRLTTSLAKRRGDRWYKIDPPDASTISYFQVRA